MLLADFTKWSSKAQSFTHSDLFTETVNSIGSVKSAKLWDHFTWNFACFRNNRLNMLPLKHTRDQEIIVTVVFTRWTRFKEAEDWCLFSGFSKYNLYRLLGKGKIVLCAFLCIIIKTIWCRLLEKTFTFGGEKSALTTWQRTPTTSRLGSAAPSTGSIVQIKSRTSSFSQKISHRREIRVHWAWSSKNFPS